MGPGNIRELKNVIERAALLPLTMRLAWTLSFLHLL